MVTPFFWAGATPSSRLRPDIASRTSGSVVGFGTPAILWASEIAANRRRSVLTRHGERSSAASARSTMYPATVAGDAGIAFSPSAAHHVLKLRQSEE